MSLTLIILLMALATFGLRLLGFLLPSGRADGFGARWIRALPIAVFGTLIGVSLPGTSALDTAVRVAALAAGAGLLARGVALWLVLAMVLGGYVALRLSVL